MDHLAKVVIKLVEIVRNQQVEIRELRGRVYAYENSLDALLDSKGIQQLRKTEKEQSVAAQGADLSPLTGLISELHALKLKQGNNHYEPHECSRAVCNRR